MVFTKAQFLACKFRELTHNYVENWYKTYLYDENCQLFSRIGQADPPRRTSFYFHINNPISSSTWRKGKDAFSTGDSGILEENPTLRIRGEKTSNSQASSLVEAILTGTQLPDKDNKNHLYVFTIDGFFLQVLSIYWHVLQKQELWSTIRSNGAISRTSFWRTPTNNSCFRKFDKDICCLNCCYLHLLNPLPTNVGPCLD